MGAALCAEPTAAGGRELCPERSPVMESHSGEAGTRVFKELMIHYQGQRGPLEPQSTMVSTGQGLPSSFPEGQRGD